ncbi:MAG: DNA-binding response regulator [Gallionellales bacterium RIFCSPLOWO2_12_FULL_59_22]|nr:MAG: DNA-binding response regulator [Gallionellales bacterium RIFCSPLOWO2_02_FULL_59_110]OGT14000.1 MAG: DNA-binding response regulator [Gallionellales bacterium RIFCSPLOWO2_12_FULL_59_22]
MKMLLVDDHVLFREGMRYVLQQLDGEETEILEAGNFQDGLKIAAQHPELDLALLDLNMPGSEGPVSIRYFHQCYPHIPVVVVSGEDGCGYMEKVMSYGALGFIHKSSTAHVMLGALNLVLSGGVYIPPEILRQHSLLMQDKEADHLDKRCQNTNEYGLTPRQMQVLTHIAAGLSNKEIAEAVCLAEGTVKIHVAGIFNTLRVGNRIEAVRVAEKLGLLDKPSHG